MFPSLPFLLSQVFLHTPQLLQYLRSFESVIGNQNKYSQVNLNRILQGNGNFFIVNRQNAD